MTTGIRVLFSFPDTLGKPGIGTTASAQVRGLVAHGAEVHLSLTSAVEPLTGVASATRSLELVGRRIPHRALGRPHAYRWHDLRTAWRLSKLAHDVDLVHVWPGAVLRTAATARRHGLPVLREIPNTHPAHAYDVVQREHRRLGLPIPRGHSHEGTPAVRAREQSECDVVTAVLCPSAHTQATFLANGFPPHRALVHRYGCDIRLFQPSTRSPHAGLNACFVGRCEPRKGLHHALRAWHDSGAAQAGGRFLIVGRFVPGYRDRLGPLLDDASIELRDFTEDPAGIMRSSDVLVLPSIEEGSALVTYEAAATGCVPVVSRQSGAWCTHRVDSLVHEAGDVETLTQHLRTLIEDKALLERLSAANIERRESLSWDAAAQALLAAYETVLSGR